MAKWDQALQDELGPPWDAVCGTKGLSTDLNAVVAAGHKRIMIAPGAVLTAALVLSTANGWLMSFGGSRMVNLGAFSIVVAASDWHLEGFEVNGASGAGIVLTASGISCTRVSAIGCGTHGFHVTSGSNHHLLGCRSWSNTGDGLRAEAATTNLVAVMCYLSFNTGWGVNDIANDCILSGGNRIEGNTAGGINGTPAVNSGNLVQ